MVSQENLLITSPPTTEQTAKRFFEFVKQLYSPYHGITDPTELEIFRGKYSKTNSLVSILEKIDGSFDAAVDSIIGIIVQEEKALKALEELIVDNSYPGGVLRYPMPGQNDVVETYFSNLSSQFSEKEQEKLGGMFSSNEIGYAILSAYIGATKLFEYQQENQKRKALILGRDALKVKEYMDSRQGLLVKDISPSEIRNGLEWMLKQYSSAKSFVEMVDANKDTLYSDPDDIMNIAYAKGIVAMNELYNALQLIEGVDGSKKRVKEQIVFSFGKSLDDVSYAYCRAVDISQPGRGDDKAWDGNVNDGPRVIQDMLPNSILEGMPEERRKVLDSFSRLSGEKYMHHVNANPGDFDPISAAYIALYAMQKPETRKQLNSFLLK